MKDAPKGIFHLVDDQESAGRFLSGVEARLSIFSKKKSNRDTGRVTIDTPMLFFLDLAVVAELVYAYDSESYLARVEGPSPSHGTQEKRLGQNPVANDTFGSVARNTSPPFPKEKSHHVAKTHPEQNSAHGKRYRHASDKIDDGEMSQSLEKALTYESPRPAKTMCIHDLPPASPENSLGRSIHSNTRPMNRNPRSWNLVPSTLL